MFLIEYENGETIYSIDKNWRTRTLSIPDIDTENTHASPDGVHGNISYGIEVNDRSGIILEFETPIKSIHEVKEKNNEVAKAFNNKDMKLFISTPSSKYGDSTYLKVQKDGVINYEVVGHAKIIFTVKLSTVGLPYFQSRYKKVYTFNDSVRFIYDNESDIDLDHRYTDTIIKITVNQSADFIEYKIGSEKWRITRSFSAGDEIEISNGTVSVNGQPAIHQATKNVIPFEPGSNQIDILGATILNFVIDTKNYYY